MGVRSRSLAWAKEITSTASLTCSVTADCGFHTEGTIFKRWAPARPETELVAVTEAARQCELQLTVAPCHSPRKLS